MNSEKGVGAIIFTGKKLAQLKLGNLVSESVVLVDQLALSFRPCGRIAFFFRQLPQRIKVGHLALELLKRLYERLEPRNFLHISLRALAIRPKITLLPP